MLSVVVAIGVIVGAWAVFTVIRAKGLWYDVRLGAREAARVGQQVSQDSIAPRQAVREALQPIGQAVGRSVNASSPEDRPTEEQEQIEAEGAVPEQESSVDVNAWIQSALAPPGLDAKQLETFTQTAESPKEQSLTDVQSE